MELAVRKLRQRDLGVLLDAIARRTSPADAYGCKRLTHTTGDGFSCNSKGYVQIRGTLVNEGLGEEEQNPDIDKNTKFQLHQVIAFELATEDLPDATPETRTAFEAYFNGDLPKSEVSHLCPHKDCTTRAHFWPEDGWVNKSRWFCPVVILINGYPHPCCKHTPQCILSREHLENALAYWTD